MSHDEDEDFDEPTTGERLRAKSFGDLVDKVVSGRVPPAMSAEDRELVDAAMLIRGESAQLPAAKVGSLIDSALRKAVAEEPAGGAAPAPVVPLAARRSRAPWVIAGASTLVAVAAVLALLFRPTPHAAPPPPPVAVKAPASWTSRPTDEIVGVIPEAKAGDAASRIDEIFADRLDGYRDRTLARGGR